MRRKVRIHRASGRCAWRGKVAELLLVPASPTVDFSFDFQDLRLLPLADSARSSP